MSCYPPSPPFGEAQSEHYDAFASPGTRTGCATGRLSATDSRSAVRSASAAMVSVGLA